MRKSLNTDSSFLPSLSTLNLKALTTLLNELFTRVPTKFLLTMLRSQSRTQTRQTRGAAKSQSNTVAEIKLGWVSLEIAHYSKV